VISTLIKKYKYVISSSAMYIFSILMSVGAITEKEVNRVLDEVVQKIQMLNQQIDLVTGSMSSMKQIRSNFVAMSKNECVSKNLFAFHFDKFAATRSNLSEYFLAYENFLCFLPYMINTVTITSIDKQNTKKVIDLKAMKKHIKDSEFFKNYTDEIYLNVEKLKGFETRLYECLEEIRSMVAKFDYFYKRIENGVILDIFSIKALNEHHYCNNCNSLPLSEEFYRSIRTFQQSNKCPEKR
ncbi:hypothetical protein THOM_2986, partial [Trachipleistophora hominis]